MFEFLFGKTRRTRQTRQTRRSTKRRGTKRTTKRRGTKRTYKRRGTKRATYKRKSYKRRGTKRTYKRRAKSVINNSKVLLQINNSAQHVIDNITSAGGSPKEVAEAVAATVADIAESNRAPPEEVVHIAQKMAVDSAITAGASPEVAAKAAEDAGHSALAVIGNDYPPIPVVNMMYLMLLIAKEMEAKDAMPAEIGVVQDAVQQSVSADGSVSVPEVVDAANKAVPGQQWGYNILNAVVDTAESMISGVVPKKKYGPETKPQTWGYDLLNNVKNYGVDKTKNISAKAGKSIYDVSKAMGSTQNAGEGEPLMLFGRHRRSRFCGKCNQSHFGSKCSRMPNNEMCTNYMTPGGSYPCFSTDQGCRRRWDRVSRHQSYVKQTSRSSIVRNVLSFGNVSRFGNEDVKKHVKAFVNDVNSKVLTKSTAIDFTKLIFTKDNLLHPSKLGSMNTQIVSFFTSRVKPIFVEHFSQFKDQLPVVKEDVTKQLSEKIKSFISSTTSYVPLPFRIQAKAAMMILLKALPITMMVHSIVDQMVSSVDSLTSFGKRRRSVKRRKSIKRRKMVKKLPKAFVKKCRRYGIKTTKKVGSKRVQKKMSVLKKQLKKAMKK